MPELPEVETMCRSVAPVVGCRISDIICPRSHLRPINFNPGLDVIRRRVKGLQIERIDRLGKRVILVLKNEDRMVLEPRMTGIVLLKDPPNETHIRLEFQLTGGKTKRMFFWDQRGLGVVSLFTPNEFQRELNSGRIGPDALTATPKILQERFGRVRRPIKVALLDQNLLAGIGNLYASEILHRAHIHPAASCDKLSMEDWKAVSSSMKKVLNLAIKNQGSTLRDGTYRVGREESGNFQQFHRVYQRAGQPCKQCKKAEIVRIVQAQRSTFFCPVCQPE